MSERYSEFLHLRPLNVRRALPGSRCALVSSRDIAAEAAESGAIVMAANVRNPLTALGVFRAAKKADSFVLLELAKSESTYTGVSFVNLPWYAAHYSATLGDGMVFASFEEAHLPARIWCDAGRRRATSRHDGGCRRCGCSRWSACWSWCRLFSRWGATA